MKICFVIKRYAPLVGGAENQAHQLASWLTRHGVHVNVITQQHSSAHPRHEEMDGVKIHRLKSLTQLPLMMTLARREIDLIHSHGATGSLNLLAGALARCCRIAVLAKVATAGDVCGLAARPFGAIRLKLLRQADAFACLSDEIEAELLAGGIAPKRIHRLPNAIDIQKFSFRPQSEGQRLLYVGRLVARKGLDVLLQAWPTVLERCPNAELWIAGSGGSEPDSVEPQLRAKAAASNYRDTVRFLGTSNQVSKLLGQANLFVFPSRCEGQPGALLEAMASGVPVVATAIGGITDLIRNGVSGRLVPINDPDSLAAAIINAIIHREQTATWAQAARRHIENSHTLDHVGKQYLSIYEKLCH